jgi:choline dehydrogenase-like flavoprotein
MLGDSSRIERDAALACDVCIIGGGPAGITLALELAKASRDVILLESGGFQRSAETQDLNAGELLGSPQFPLDASRLRMLGGTTGHWAGMCRPLDPEDFEPRAWVPNSGWPITRAELDPYYLRAHTLCELGPFDYTRTEWPELLRHDDGLARMNTSIELLQISPPTRFGKLYRRPLANAPGLRVLLHSTVSELVPNPSGRHIEHAEVRGRNGARFSVHAKSYVAACGGIENARLLLLSNRFTPNGLGNDRDWLGRCFMDHPSAQPLGVIQLLRKDMHRIVQRHKTERGQAMVGLHLDGETQRRERLLSSAFYVGPPDSPAAPLTHAPVGEATLRFLQQTSGDKTELHTATCWLRSEQAPNPDSRVTLSDETDALGQRRVRLDWQLTEVDHHSLRESALHYVRALGASGFGRIRMEPWLTQDAADWASRIRAGWHHMGTTRMAESSSHGFVDRNCRAFSVDNLYVAGSSVFPTSGFANPTLTLVALALRLADHLEQDTGRAG